MTKYKIWQAPVFAFFSTQFYREVGCKGKGVGFVYLLVVLAISIGAQQLKNLPVMQTQWLTQKSQIAIQFPEVTIKNGKLSINRESPAFISDPETGDYLIAFDTSGQGLISPELNIPIIVTADGLKRDGGFSSFRGIDHFVLGPKELRHWLKVGVYAVPAISFLLGVPIAWFAHILQAVGFSLAGLLLARTIGVNIKYKGILRIACFALGNIIILDGIVNMFPLDIPGYGPMQVNIPYWELQKFVFALGYTLFGVGANLSAPGFESVSENNEQQSV